MHVTEHVRKTSLPSSAVTFDSTADILGDVAGRGTGDKLREKVGLGGNTTCIEHSANNGYSTDDLGFSKEYRG